MPRNPDLVPTTIVDVNGRTTVVHRLRDVFSSSTPKRSGSKIPSPSIPSARAWKSTLVKALMKTVPRHAGLTDKADIKKLDKKLLSFPEASLRFFCEVMVRGDGVSAGVAKQLAECNLPEDSFDAEIVARNLGDEIRTNAMSCDLVETDNYDEIKQLVLGLRLQTPFIGKELYKLNDRIVVQAAAVMKATKRLADEYPASIDDKTHPVDKRVYSVRGTGLVLNEALFKMVMSRPEEMEQIVDAVIENKTMNPETINGVIMGISAPLADGAL